MRFGFYVPNFDVFGDARVLAGLACEAEQAGWDGFFIWDHLQVVEPAVDPWVALTAMALATNRIRLGTLVTPLPRRHIAKLAREVTSLDQLSNGRMVLGAGAGFPYLPDYAAFGDGSNPKVRAAKLDEGLDLLVKLWSGEPVRHVGEHYQVVCEGFASPVQRPRPPVWIGAGWPAKRPIRRAARWDGVVPAGLQGLEVTPEDLASIVDMIRQERGDLDDFDVVRFGATGDPSDTVMVRACADAGATWWMEYVYAGRCTLESVRERLSAGPPAFSSSES